MRTKIGYGLIALSVPYVVVGLLLGWDSLAMGATALILSGGVLVARDARRRRTVPGGPAIPKAPRTPTIPPVPAKAPEETTAAPPAPAPDPDWKEGDVILPPPPVRPSGTPKLTLIHSDGRRVDVRDFRRRAAGGK